MTRQATGEFLEKTDQILSELQRTRRMLPGKDFVLLRFLQDTESYAETIYEQSTVTCTEDDDDNAPQDLPIIPPPAPSIPTQNEEDASLHPHSSSYSSKVSGSELSGEVKGEQRLVEEYKLIRKRPFDPFNHVHAGLKAFSLSRDGRFLASLCGRSMTVEVWDWASEPDLFVCTYQHKGSPIASMALSSDGHRLALGLRNGDVVLWERATVIYSQQAHFSRLSRSGT